MKAEEIYYKIQSEIKSYDDIMSYYKEEEKYRNLLENDLNFKHRNLRLFRLNQIKYRAEEIVPARLSITSKTKREGIEKKVKKLAENCPNNKYILSNESLTDDDKKYGKYSFCVNEYESVKLADILREHSYFYNLNLPCKNQYSLMSSTAEYIYENGNNRKETNIKDNFYYHNSLLTDINNYITENIISIFNNPIGERIYSILRESSIFKGYEIIEIENIANDLTENEMYEYMKCLVILNLPWNVKLIAKS